MVLYYSADYKVGNLSKGYADFFMQIRALRDVDELVHCVA